MNLSTLLPSLCGIAALMVASMPPLMAQSGQVGTGAPADLATCYLSNVSRLASRPGAVDRGWTLQDFSEKRHAEVRLWPIYMKQTDKAQSGTAEASEMRRQHFLYWWDLEEKGKLFGSGPMDSGTPNSIGLAIVVAATREEAETLAHNEPYHKAGWRVNTVHTWSLNEGTAVPVGRALTGLKREYVTSVLECGSEQ